MSLFCKNCIQTRIKGFIPLSQFGKCDRCGEMAYCADIAPDEPEERAATIACCLTWAGNENDNLFRFLVGHHPGCRLIRDYVEQNGLAERVNSIFSKSDNRIKELEGSLQMLTKYPELVQDFYKIVSRLEVENFEQSDLIASLETKNAELSAENKHYKIIFGSLPRIYEQELNHDGRISSIIEKRAEKSKREKGETAD